MIKKLQSTGKKKTAVASVVISKSSKGSYLINGREAINYFQGQDLPVALSVSPFASSEINYKDFSILVKASGGGLVAQSYAIRHAISQVLAKMFPEKRTIIKKFGFLTRDSRIVERKKPGLRKARKKEQFSKR